MGDAPSKSAKTPGASRAPKSAAPPELDALGRTVGELLNEMLRVDSDQPEFAADLEAAVRHVREATDCVRRHAKSLEAMRLPFMPSDDVPADARPYYVLGPIVGAHNPVFPLVHVHCDGERTTGNIRFPLRFEGPPGKLHGGTVALFFDQILGHHNVASGTPAMTGTLTVRYHKPTPLFRDLHFEVTAENRGPRKVANHGRLWEGEELLAEAEGLFIRPKGPWKG